MKEIWIDIEGWEGYQVSNLGNVRSLDREVVRSDGMVLHLKGKLLAQNNNTRGYPHVSLSKSRKIKSKIRTHRLVGLHFLDNPNNYSEINHIDGNKENNRADNLEWCTRSHNMQHCWDNGYREHVSVSLRNRHRKGGMIGISNDQLSSLYFRCSRDAETFGYDARKLRYWCQKKLNRSGYTWSYINEMIW